MGNAFLLIVVGLLLFYIVISDKFFCVEGFVGCLTGANKPSGSGNVPAINTNPAQAPVNPSLAAFPNVNWGFYNGV